MNKQNKTTIIRLLEAIPKWDDGAISIKDWLNRAEVKEDMISDCVDLIISVLKVFDAIAVYESEDDELRKIKSNSEIAYYFINSLAIHMLENKKILSNWERTGVRQGGFNVQDFLSGPQFLYAIEYQRTVGNDNPHAIRNSTVVKAIIKARVQGFNKPVFLTQYDEVAKQYQLIGGHTRSTDSNYESAMRREITEELNQENFSDVFEFDMRFLEKVEIKEVSLTFGVFTEYQLQYFQPFFKMRQIKLGPNDRWLTLKELLSGKTKNGDDINESAISILNNKLPGGLEGLKLSSDQIQKRSLIQIVKDHPWEVIGIVLSIIGILVSIFLYFLS